MLHEYSATRANLSWFVQSTHPNFVMVSPAFSPAESAGLPSMTLLTFAKGASKAAAVELLAEGSDVAVDEPS